MIVQRCADDDTRNNIGYCFRFVRTDGDGYHIGYVNTTRRGSWDNREEILECGHKIIMEEIL